MSDVSLDIRVLELLSSRICHDLVSPVGAVNNGIELMEELGVGAGKDALDLISSSVDQATIRLKCFRLCYGAGGSESSISFGDVHEVFADWVKGVRSELNWDVMNCVSLETPLGFMKVLLNVLLLAEECNPGNGTISVEPLEGKNGVTVTASGKPTFRDGVEKALMGTSDVSELDPRLVHAYVTGKFAAHFGIDLSWNDDNGRDIIFTIS